MSSFITPKGWDGFQHYRDRKPAWIKLHRDLLDNFDYHCLPIASKALAPMLWLLASEYEDGRIPADWRMIAFRLRMTAEEVQAAVTPLISSGFFVASELLADRKRSACLEREEETEEEREKELHVPDGTCSSSPATGDDLNDKRVVNFPKADPVDYQGVVDLYHRLLCPPMQRCLILSDKRKAHLRQRWRDALPNLSEWEAYFQHIAKSDFLMGRSIPAPGRKSFVADLDWIIKSENFVKIAERKYHE